VGLEGTSLQGALGRGACWAGSNPSSQYWYWAALGGAAGVVSADALEIAAWPAMPAPTTTIDRSKITLATIILVTITLVTIIFLSSSFRRCSLVRHLAILAPIWPGIASVLSPANASSAAFFRP